MSIQISHTKEKKPRKIIIGLTYL